MQLRTHSRSYREWASLKESREGSANCDSSVALGDRVSSPSTYTVFVSVV